MMITLCRAALRLNQSTARRIAQRFLIKSLLSLALHPDGRQTDGQDPAVEWTIADQHELRTGRQSNRELRRSGGAADRALHSRVSVLSELITDASDYRFI